MDCLEAMRDFKDNEFDLAIVDPPYGIGQDGQKFSQQKGKGARRAHEFKGWDICPEIDYFNELYRISQNQIIWGANYYGMFQPSPCWVAWDKMQSFSGADMELAYTSFKTPCKAFRMSRIEAYGMGGDSRFPNSDKIHPTQKPVKLYEWLLKNYAKEGDKILDTHLGSGSSAIACHNMGFEFTGYEIDEDYFKSAKARLEEHQKQQQLFIG